MYDDFATNVIPHVITLPDVHILQISPFAFSFCPFLIRQIRLMSGLVSWYPVFFQADNFKHAQNLERKPPDQRTFKNEELCIKI